MKRRELHLMRGMYKISTSSTLLNIEKLHASISDREKDLTISTHIQHFSAGSYTCSTKRQRNKRCKNLKGKKSTYQIIFYLWMIACFIL